jgi:D-alanyl-D-alanine carboxypeptidase
MSKRIAPWFLGLFLVLAGLAWARTVQVQTPSPQTSAEVLSAGARAAFLGQLGGQLEREFAKNSVGGMSVGVVSGSKLIWSGHYGYADVEAKRVATNDTAYRIGSITKQFTALALMQMVEQGRMRLVEPLEKYLPEIKTVKSKFGYAPPITLLQVATMTSGLGREPGKDCVNHSVGPVSSWQKIVLECLPTVQYDFEPGTQYLYSNIGYASLGLAIERAGGRPFTALVADGILKPLGMTRTAFEPAALRTDLAHGYVRRGDTPSREGPDRELDGRGYRVPNGALFSTINDLAKFVAWEVGEGPAGILKKETQDANYLRVYSATGGRGALAMTSGYGLGFMASRDGHDDVVFLGHGGSTAGYRASAIFHRPTRLGVIVLRNSELDPAGVAGRTLRQLVNTVTTSSGGALPAAAGR